MSVTLFQHFVLQVRWEQIVRDMQREDWSAPEYSPHKRHLVREYGRVGEGMIALGLEKEAARIANETV